MKIDRQHIINHSNYLVIWIEQLVRNNRKKGVIFGISGGIDSALVAVLARKAFPNNHLGVILPTRDMKENRADIAELVEKYSIKTKEIDLQESFENLKSTLNLKSELAISNIQPRLRMTVLYALAQELDYLVVGTGNFSEIFLGYFTKYGDGGVDMLPLAKLTKSDVYTVAKTIGIPEKFIQKKPSANLWENQTDEEDLGFSYQDLEKYLKKPDSVSKEIAKKIELLHEKSEHKREPIPTPDVRLEEKL